MPPFIDPDPQETQEWRDAFVAMLQAHGKDRGVQMLEELGKYLPGSIKMAPSNGAQDGFYVNTIAPSEQGNRVNGLSACLSIDF